MNELCLLSWARDAMLQRRCVWLVASAAAFSVSACGSSEDSERGEGSAKVTAADFPRDSLPGELVADLPLIAPKDSDFPVFSDPIDVLPGEDRTYCTFTNVILKEPTIFGESFGAQSPMGHHAILVYTTQPQEPHTGPCGGMDGEQLLGGTGGKSVSDTASLPTNYGVEVPAGAQLVINHHWINTGREPVRGQSLMIARTLKSGGETVKAGSLAMVSIGWELPPQSPFESTTECTFQEDVPFVIALGHMHEWGSRVKIEVERAGSATDTLIDAAWSVEAATTGGTGYKQYTLESPYMIRKGDTVRLTCNWKNTTSESLEFPREMCVFFGNTIGASYICANGAWLKKETANELSGDIMDHL
ncbi:MAG TPA: hypothetical protein VK524_16015 [Polyangiaceae bacterium]|nr:hypothetical protein [Polyangiaceae bacterium]